MTDVAGINFKRPEPTISQRQALEVVVSILNKEKSADDYGYQVLKQSKGIFGNMLEAIKVEEDTIVKPDPKTELKAMWRKEKENILKGSIRELEM